MENPYQSPEAEPRGRRPTIYWISLFGAGVGIPLFIELAIVHWANVLDRFLWLANQAVGFPAFAWPLSLPLVFWFMYAARAFEKRGQEINIRFLWLIPVLVLPTVALTWAALHKSVEPGVYDRQDLQVLTALMLVQFSSTGVAILANRGQRAIVASIALLASLFAVGCDFVGAMNITGDWL